MTFAALVAWAELGKVVLVGLIGGVGLVVTWGVLLLGLDRTVQIRQGARSSGAAVYSAIALAGGTGTIALLLLGLWALTQK